MFDIIEFVVDFGIFVVIFVAVLFLVAVAVYSVKAEKKQIACYVKRMDAKRVTFTTDVTCVPRSLDTRNDTLTVQSR